jgi:signal transduction histidine kinase
MRGFAQFLRPLRHVLPGIVCRLIASPQGAQMVTRPPFSWVVRAAVHARARRLLEAETPIFAPAPLLPRTTIEAMLDGIARDVVETLGYVAAMVAIYEPGDILAIRSIYLDPQVASIDQLRRWELEVSRFTPYPVSLTDPAVARVDIRDLAYAENLSYIAAHTLTPQIRNDLHSLFVPIVPAAARPLLAELQLLLGIRQVIAVPFFQDATGDDGSVTRELVGNLFAVKRDLITPRDVNVLTAFGRQAAAALQNERLKLQVQLVQELVADIQRNLEHEEQIFQLIVRGVVEKLGYLGALISTAEPDDSLPIRGSYLHPTLSVSATQAWEDQLLGYGPDGPDEQRIWLDTDGANLSVAAAQSGRPAVGADLAQLLTPTLGHAARAQIRDLQQMLRVRQIAAISLFVDRPDDEGGQRTFVGTLAALSHSRSFRRSEIQALEAFAQQAAVGLHNARLYQRSEVRRRAAEIFGKMAFTASASAHALRNDVGAVHMWLRLFTMLEALDTEQRQQLFDQIPHMLNRLHHAADLLDHLSRPSQVESESLVDVRACLLHAAKRVLPQQAAWVHLEVAAELAPVRAIPDMLTEAFKVLLKNGAEAIDDRFAPLNGQPGEQRRLEIIARHVDAGTWSEGGHHDQREIVVSIRDNGQGIKREDLRRIFDLGWTTKTGVGYGFGLFWTIDYIEGLGGRIEVASTWNEGTTFDIYLPVASFEMAAAEEIEAHIG